MRSLFRALCAGAGVLAATRLSVDTNPANMLSAELPWRKRPWNRYGTKVRLLPPHRLSRKTASLERLINGVYTDADGKSREIRCRALVLSCSTVETARQSTR